MLRRILVILGYTLAAVVVIGGTVGLVAYGEGYSYDWHTGRLSRNGLVLVASVPNGADITRNNQKIGHRTPYRSFYRPGNYLFTATKAGFHTWSKLLQVAGGQVTSAQYIVMVPNKPTTTTIATATATFVTPTVSHDRRHLAYASAPTAADGAGIYTLGLPSGLPQRVYSLPAASPTVPAETVTGLQWSRDASHLLVTSQSASGVVYRVMSASGGGVVDLSTQYQLDFPGLQFSPANWQQLYWVSGGGLHRLDLSAQSVSSVLAANVSQFSFAGNRLLFVQTTSLGQSLESFDISNPSHIQQLLPALPNSPSYSLAYATYLGTDELAIIPASTHNATIYSGIFGSGPVSTVVATGVDQAQFSVDGHLLTLYSGNKLVTYDLSLSTPTQVVISASPTLPAPITSLSWFDNYHLLLDLGGQTYFSDYDGTNMTALMPNVPGFPLFSSNDLRTVYSFGPTGDHQRLVSIVIRP